VPVDIHDLFACVAPRALLNITALDDFQYTRDEEPFTRAAWANLGAHVQRVYALLGAGGRFRQALHTKGHGFEAAERELAYAFVAQLHQGGRAVPCS
jgi:hypothetical protein